MRRRRQLRIAWKLVTLPMYDAVVEDVADEKLFHLEALANTNERGGFLWVSEDAEQKLSNISREPRSFTETNGVRWQSIGSI